MKGTKAASVSRDVSDEELLRNLSESAESGDPAAMFNLARLYETGSLVEDDCGRAFALYCLAAGSGFKEAVYSMAVLALENDLDMEGMDPLLNHNPQGASRLDAVRALGEAYYFGDGTEPDEEKAFQYFRAGSYFKDPACMFDCAAMILGGKAAAEYPGQEYDLLLESAEAGYGPAAEIVRKSEESADVHSDDRERAPQTGLGRPRYNSRFRRHLY